MDNHSFNKLKKFIKTLAKTYEIKDLVAEVYNLYQEYLIDDTQEETLYKLVDPNDLENCPAELWFSDNYGCIELYEFACAV